VAGGDLVRVGPGVYTANSDESLSETGIVETSAMIPGGVICLLSALAFHELTTQNPFEVWLAVERKAWVPTVRRSSLRIVYFTGEAFHSGIAEHRVNGVTVRVYEPAKTVADCFKYRNKLGIDVAIEALRDAWRQRKATMDELWHYARVCRV
jgi:predicted transcriptional regulator of viral defense system